MKMGEFKLFKNMLTNQGIFSLSYMTNEIKKERDRLFYYLIAILITTISICGCSPFNEGRQTKITLKEANDLFNQGDYNASLEKYKQVIANNPSAKDRVLFEMGIIYAHPKNESKNYQKSLESFHEIINEYPESAYRQNSEMMMFYINNVIIKDKKIATQQANLETLQKEIKIKKDEIAKLQQQNEQLEQKIFDFAILIGRIDKILIEKKERRLTLILRGEVLKTYKIALGGNPIGPKERQGDNKTPEGIYYIDAKNKNSQYHLSLHISYPNESDKKRAQELGASPGGDIMIHGIKNGLSEVGKYHAEVDWTKGCIAVTDEEIEEIDKLTPIGTVVEIKP